MTTPTQTKFQSEVRTIHRSEIKNAPYNPRVISDKAFKAIKKNLSSKGLMSTLTWNEATGNLVSGHQRLQAIDQLEKKSEGDYHLTVSVCNLSEKEEKEQNIFFNSTTVQGEFDFGKLADIFAGGVDPFAAGFDENDLNILGIAAFEEEITTTEQSKDKEFLKQGVKDAKQKARQRIEDRYEEGETYLTLSFSTYEAKKAFCRKWGIPPNDLFIKGEKFDENYKNQQP